MYTKAGFTGFLRVRLSQFFGVIMAKSQLFFSSKKKKKSVLLSENNKMSDFVSSNLQNCLISKAFK